MKVPFDQTYNPPAPILSVHLINPDEGLRVEGVHALIDTGSDGTLVPIKLLRDILATPLSLSRIRSHWGEWRDVHTFVVDIVVGHVTLPHVLVVGDEVGTEVVLGRNVLNMLRLYLNGPEEYTEVHV